jgi:hypothetical protein
MLPFGISLGFPINVGAEFVPTGSDTRVAAAIDPLWSVSTLSEDLMQCVRITAVPRAAIYARRRSECMVNPPRGCSTEYRVLSGTSNTRNRIMGIIMRVHTSTIEKWNTRTRLHRDPGISCYTGVFFFEAFPS